MGLGTRLMALQRCNGYDALWDLLSRSTGRDTEGDKKMKDQAPDKLLHRCGTCGTIFGSLQELAAHVNARHVTGAVSGDGEAQFSARQPRDRAALPFAARQASRG